MQLIYYCGWQGRLNKHEAINVTGLKKKVENFVNTGFYK